MASSRNDDGGALFLPLPYDGVIAFDRHFHVVCWCLTQLVTFDHDHMHVRVARDVAFVYDADGQGCLVCEEHTPLLVDDVLPQS